MTWPAFPTNGVTTTINGVEYIYDGANLVWNRVGLGTTNTTINSITVANLVVSQTARLGDAANVIIGGGSPGLYLTGNGAGGLAWQPPQAASLVSNGTSNLNVTASGNITVSVAGTANSVVFTGTGVNVAGYANIVGNINAGNISIGKLTSTVAIGTAPLTVTSTTRVANLNVDRANISDYSIVTRQASGVYYPTLINGNATSNYSLGVTPNINFDITSSTLNSKNVTITNNVNTDNLTASSNVTTSNLSVSATANLIGSNILLGSNANVKLTGGSTGQVLQTDGTGNLSWTPIGLSSIANGSSNVSVASSSNVTIGVSGNSGILTVTGTGANINGYANITGNITSSGNITVSGNINSSTLTSTVVTGTAPLIVTSTTRVGNLNVSRSNISDYTSVTNTNSGCVYVAFANSSSTGNYALQSNTALYANLSSGNFYAANFIGNFIGSVTGSASTAGTVTTASQPNITSVGTLTGLVSGGVIDFTSTSNVSLGSVSNIKIQGGSSGQYLKTDGAGNVSWNSIIFNNIANGTSNVIIPTTNGNINHSVNGNTTFVITGTGANIVGYANVNGNVTTTGNIDVIGNVNASIPISSVESAAATLTATTTTRVNNLNVARANISDYTAVTTAASGNMNFTFANANNTSNYSLYSNTAIYANISSGSIYAANFVGNGSQLSGIAGANVTGTVGIASVSGTAATVTTAAQPNITSVGTLTSLSVTGTVTAATFSGSHSGSGAGLTNIPAGNITGSIPSAGTVTTNAQPNITSVGTLTSLNVSGLATFGFSQDVTVSGAPSGTVNYDLNNGVVFDVVPTANWTANVSNIPSVNNRTTVVTFIITQGATAYVPNVFQISGSAQTVKWVGGGVPLGTIGKIDVVSYSIIRSNVGGYSVLGQYASYG